jgi:hypothetical protein
MTVTAEVLGLAEFDRDVFKEKTDRIIAAADRQLTFIFCDGSEVRTVWRPRKKASRKSKGV